ncbi:MAG: Mu-like prophage major head subunit gpT family protein [Candidatus Binataceae bacterium]
MEINLQNLNALFYGFNTIFQRGFDKPPTYYDRLATIVPSSASRELYPWLGRTTAFREWLGDRMIQALERHGYTIVNRDFENTVAVDRNDIEDDTYGILTPMFEQLGWDAKVHPDTLLFGLLKAAVQNIDSPSTAGAIVGYDGSTFFSRTGHPVGKAGGKSTATPNCDPANGSAPFWYLVDVSRPIRPFIVQKRKEYQFVRMNTPTDEAVFMRREFRFGVDARLNTGVSFWQLAYASNQDLSNSNTYANAIGNMRSIKTDAGVPFGAAYMMDAANMKLLVPPALEEVGRRLLHAELVAGGAGGRAGSQDPQSNVWMNSAELIVSPYLA